MLSKITLPLALAFAVITMMQAQAQEHVPGAPPAFNGLVWDPPGYTAPEVTGELPAIHHLRKHRSSE